MAERSNYMFKAPWVQRTRVQEFQKERKIEKGAIPVSNKLDIRLMDSMTAT